MHSEILTSRQKIFAGDYFSQASNPDAVISHVEKRADRSVTDDISFKSAELDKLHRALCDLVPKKYRSLLGTTSLLESMIRPAVSSTQIQLRQDAVTELEKNPELVKAIESILEAATDCEDSMHRYFRSNGNEMRSSAGCLRSFKELVRTLAKPDTAIKNVESVLLKQAFEDISEYADSRPGRIVQGPALFTIAGLRPKKEARFLPRYHYRLAPFDIVSLAAIATLGAGWMGPDLLKPGAPTTQVSALVREHFSQGNFTDMRVLGLLALYGWNLFLMKNLTDATLIHSPIVNMHKKDESFLNATDALGFLGEIYTLYTYNKFIAENGTKPEIQDGDEFSFSVKKQRNPLGYLRDQSITANSFSIQENRLNSLTGGNSDGKTFTSKGIMQNQLLVQLGANALAESYVTVPADNFFYYLVNSGSLDQSDGNFGIGLARIEELIYERGVTKRSLVILDELCEGTTQREKNESSGPILHLLALVRPGVLWPNHNPELVDELQELGLCAPWKIEVIDGMSTRQIIEGTSRNSGAIKVTRKHRLDPQSLRDWLMEQGIEPPERFVCESN
jgi:DNA mismatch repair ATPase MutS